MMPLGSSTPTTDGNHEGRASLYSFDVFDTCITRPYMAPTDLFRTLARRVLLHAGQTPSPERIDGLQRARIKAESQFRRRHPELEDISLDQIYQSLAEFVAPELDLVAMQSMEIDLEIDCCVPVAAALDKVRRCRDHGKVVFVSDMYLPADVIRRMLIKCGFWSEADTLYVSNELGRSKHLTSLFHWVMAREKVTPRQVVHTGDNPRSDVRVPRRVGIRAQLFDETRLKSYELAAVRQSPRHAVREFIGVNRAVRLSTPETGDPRLQPPASLVHSVIAPFLVVFVAWVLRQAKQDGRERLYFVSRDAQVFHKIASILSEDDDAMELRYLYGSRKAWFAPSIQTGSRDEIRWAFEADMERTPRAIIRRLDLDSVEFTSELRQSGFSDPDEALDEHRTAELVDFIIWGDIGRAARKRADSTRTDVLGYLTQEGLLDDVNWSLVDIGWVLKCQRCLQAILRSNDPNARVHGYYLGVTENHVARAQGGGFDSYFAHSRAEQAGAHSGDWIFHIPSILLLEHLFTPATHGTVIGYRGGDRFEPVTRESAAQSELYPWVANFHSMVENHAHALANSTLLRDHLDELMPAANNLLHSFLFNPERRDVEQIGWLATNAEQSHYKEHERRLASPLSLRDLFGIVGYELGRKATRYVHPDHTWLAGSAALSGTAVRHLFRIMHNAKRFLDRRA